MTTAAVEKVPTLEEIRELEGRAAEIRSLAREIEARLGAIQTELAQLHAEGLAATPEAKDLRQERERLQTEDSELQAALSHMEERIATEREIACRSEAQRRITEIAQAHRELRPLLDERAEQIVEQAKELEGAIRRANDDFACIAHLEAEAKVLAARFELEAPRFPSAPQPMQRNAVRAGLSRLDDLPGPGLPRRFTVSYRASADPAERKSDLMRAVNEYLEAGHLGQSEAAEIIREVGGG